MLKEDVEKVLDTIRIGLRETAEILNSLISRILLFMSDSRRLWIMPYVYNDLKALG